MSDNQAPISTSTSNAPVKDYSVFVAFFVELANRFVSKTPAFYNVIKWISIILTAITFVPLFTNVTVFEGTWNSIVRVSGIVSAIIAQLAVENKSELVSKGELPLTAKKDDKV